MIKLIAIDLDGTLLDSQKQLPPNFGSIIDQLYAHGVRIVIASGRQYFNIRQLFTGYEDKLFFISENGGLIFENQTNLFAAPIETTHLHAALDAIKEYPQLTPVLCGEKSAYLHPADTFIESNVCLYYQKRLYSPRPLEAAKQDRIVKIAVFDHEDATPRWQALAERFKQTLSVTLSGKNWLDFMKHNIDKGTAIRHLQQHLQITPNESMAFGDYINDVEMLRQVHYSYAMANAHEYLKKIARFQAPSNDQLGVISILNNHFNFLK